MVFIYLLIHLYELYMIIVLNEQILGFFYDNKHNCL